MVAKCNLVYATATPRTRVWLAVDTIAVTIAVAITTAPIYNASHVRVSHMVLCYVMTDTARRNTAAATHRQQHAHHPGHHRAALVQLIQMQNGAASGDVIG